MMKIFIQICFLLILLPELAEAKKTELFFTQPDVNLIEMNPSGSHIALLRQTEKTYRIDLYDTLSKKQSTLINFSDFSDEESEIKTVDWIDDEHIAAQFVESREGVKDLIDTQYKSSLIIIKLPKKDELKPTVYRVRTNGWLVSPLEAKPDHFLFAKSGVYSKVYLTKVSKLNKFGQKLNKLMKVDGGQFKAANEVASIKGFATRWLIDKNLNSPTAVVFYNENNNLALASLDADMNATQIAEWPDSVQDTDETKKLVPILSTEDKNVFYCIDLNEDLKRSIFRVNFSTNSNELVYETNAYEILELIQDETSSALIGVQVIEDGKFKRIYFDSSKNKQEKPQTDVLKVNIDQSLDGNLEIIYTEAHNLTGRFTLIRENNESEVLAHYFPELSNKLASKMEEYSINVDGMEVHYLLNMPLHKRKTQFQLIVMPHGGPLGVSDTRYYHSTTQFLVANGYAVLRVNYRGSGEYSQALRDAGKKQWGDGILKDIITATNEVMAREDIGKACIFGASYGGYAALSLVSRYPTRFECAVSLSGVSDINLYLNHPDRLGYSDKWLRENVGDTTREYLALKQQSPVYSASKIVKPVFILHGRKDRTVDIEHAYRMKLVLDKYQKTYDFHVYENEGHSFSSPEVAAEAFDKILRFLQKHLDGT